MGRATRTCSLRGNIVDEVGIDALLEGSATGLDGKGSEDSGLLATALGWLTLIADEEACVG
jgi:hypothetical protein